MRGLLNHCPIRLAALFCLLAGVASAQEPAHVPDGFRTLFSDDEPASWAAGTDKDPKALAALSNEERASREKRLKRGIAEHWRRIGKVIENDGKGPFLSSAEEFENFELWVDWKIGPNGDSGIYLRGVPQVQIWDPKSVENAAKGAAHGSGGLWNNRGDGKFPCQLADRPIGTWNRMYIRMVGPFVLVRLNDLEVVTNVPLENVYDTARPVPPRGPICFQSHGEVTQFRNIRIRDIPFDESARLLAEISGGESGYVPLFDGKSLAGWTGAVGEYEVVNGAIQCRSKGIGNLFTKDVFDNFVLRFEFRLPAGGNSGLAIHAMPTDAIPAYDAFEIQVLDDSAEKYRDLHDYQYHGSLYGLHPSVRGYLRPVGDWNFQQVTVIDDRFKVELNGYTILDVSLEDLPGENLDHQAHPGLARRSGHIGFCGHYDPVAFRNLRIKRLSKPSDEAQK